MTFTKKSKKLVLAKLESIQQKIIINRYEFSNAKTGTDKMYFASLLSENGASMRSVLDVTFELGYNDIYCDFNEMLKEKFENECFNS